MNPKQKEVWKRIERFQDELAKAREYLETGTHANWRGFRPLFGMKKKDGKVLPPHPDWVRNVFIPRCERALNYLEKLLDRLESK